MGGASPAEDGELTVYVGDAGEKYSDVSEWRDLIIDDRLRAEMVIPVRRGDRLSHERAGAVPELAALFAQFAAPARPPASPTREDAQAAPVRDAGPETPPSHPGEPPAREAPRGRKVWRTTAAVQPAAAAVPDREVTLGKPAARPASEPAAPFRASREAMPQPNTSATRDRPPGADSTSARAYFVRCLTRDFLRLSGRANRKEFWSFLLGQVLVVFALAVAAAIRDAGNTTSELSPPASALLIAAVLFLLYSVLPALALLVRRLHDIGLTGWLVLLVLIPYAGRLLLLAIAALAPSQQKANGYGPVLAGAAGAA